MPKIEECKIRVTPEESKQIQNICFDNGVFWDNGNTYTCFSDKPFLSVNFDNSDEIEYGDNEQFFEDADLTEVTAQYFIDKYKNVNLTIKIADVISDIDACNYGLAKDKLLKILRDNLEGGDRE